MKLKFIFLLLLFPAFLFAQPGKITSKNKAAVINYIHQNQHKLIEWSKQIWEYAEPSFNEIKSAQLVMDALQKEGFSIEKNLCGLPTVFMASYGKSKPVIGLYGEYDADANASNKIMPRKEALVAGGYGHGGNHNLLGVGSLGAAIAIKELIKQKKLNCTIRYYGSTAEGTAGTRAYMARDGYFDDLDFSLYWHPSPGTWASTLKWDALIEFEVGFVARKLDAIHDSITAANTISAFGSFVQRLESLRKKISDSIRINYSVVQWRSDINKIPDTIKVGIKIQCARQQEAMDLFSQLKNAVDDISRETAVTHFIIIQKAMHQFLPNITAMKAVHKNMELLGPLNYSSQEQDFVKELQRNLKIPEQKIEDRIPTFFDQSENEKMYGYASDIGDASWIAPEAYFTVKTLPAVYMHTWQGTIFSGHSIGHKGMLHAAKILAMSIVDYVEDKSLQNKIEKNFTESNKLYHYQSLLEKGQLPVISK